MVEWITDEALERMKSIVTASPYRKTSDNEGQAVTMTVRVVPRHAAQIAEIAADAVHRYKTPSAALRDAIYIFLQIIDLRGGAELPERELDRLEAELSGLEHLGESIRGLQVNAARLYEHGLTDLAADIDKRVTATVAKLTPQKRDFVQAILDRMKAPQLPPANDQDNRLDN